MQALWSDSGCGGAVFGCLQLTILLETAKLRVVVGSCAVGSGWGTDRDFTCNTESDTDKVRPLGGVALVVVQPPPIVILVADSGGVVWRREC